jgi:rod shape-determining protein MreC
VGLAVAGFERGRPAEADFAWWSVYRGIVAPVLVPIGNRTNAIVDGVERFGHLWRSEAENDELRGQITQLQIQNQLSEEQIGKLRRLSGLSQWVAPPELELVPVDVIGLDARDQNAVLIVNRGRRDGIAPRDPMVALGGLVGLVREVSEREARVQAISDPLSAVGALVRDNRSRGIVQGQGRGEPLEYVPENEVQPIMPGALLLTSGFDNSVFTKGLLIGVIRKPTTNVHGMHLGEVEPAVRFGQVEEGLVIVPRGRRAAGAATPTPPLGQYTLQMPDLVTTQTAITSDSLALSAADGALEPDRDSTGSLIHIDEKDEEPGTKDER